MAKKVKLVDMKPGAARNARIAALAANPGTRSKIPDALLPSKYKAARATAQRMKTENATLYNPAQILSGKDLRSAVKSTVNLQLNPQLAAYDTGIKSTERSRDLASQKLAGYSNFYNAAAADAASKLSSSGQQLATQLAQQGQQTQQQFSDIQADIDKRNAADIALRGPGLQDNNAAAQAVNFAKTQAAGANQTQQNQAAALSGGFAGLGGTIAAVAPMRANEALAGLAGKFNTQIADMQGKRAALEATRGDLTSQTLQKMREDQFTNLATMKGLDIKQADLQETVRKNKATEALTGAAINQRNLASIRTARTAHERNVADSAYKKAQIDIKRGIDPLTGKKLPSKPQSASDALSAWKLKFAQDHGYLPTTGAPKGGAGGVDRATTPQITSAQKSFSGVVNAIRNAKSDFPGNRASGGTGAIKAIIGEKPNTDPLMASIAADVVYDGHISSKNLKKLRARGLKVSDLEGVVGPNTYKSMGRSARGKIPGTR